LLNVLVKELAAFWAALKTDVKKPPPEEAEGFREDEGGVLISSIIGVSGGFIDCESLLGCVVCESERARRWEKDVNDDALPLSLPLPLPDRFGRCCSSAPWCLSIGSGEFTSGGSFSYELAIILS
jgi:hypothetical protein